MISRVNHSDLGGSHRPASHRPAIDATREALLATANGAWGDHLVASGNPLAIRMALRQNGRPLTLEREALRAALPQAGRTLLVLVHGFCASDLQWQRHGHDHGAALARDLGYTPLYLHYNSGLHVSANGRRFADLLATLVREWPQPVAELAIVGHSMGGLVARSACYYAAAAGQAWLRCLRKLVFIATPHYGTPLERAGNRVGSLLDEDWPGRDRFALTADRRRSVPLPQGVACYAMAATLGARPDDLTSRLLGDGLVPLASALGRHPDPTRSLPIPESQQWVGCRMRHTGPIHSLAAYEKLREWLAS